MGKRYSIKEAAERLGYSKSRVYQFVNAGKLGALQVSRQYKIEISEEALQEFERKRIRQGGT